MTRVCLERLNLVGRESNLHRIYLHNEVKLEKITQVRKASYLRVILGVTLIGRTVEKNDRENH